MILINTQILLLTTYMVNYQVSSASDDEGQYMKNSISGHNSKLFFNHGSTVKEQKVCFCIIIVFQCHI